MKDNKKKEKNIPKEYNILFEKFKNLGLNDKRNFLNKEIIKIEYLIKEYLKSHNLNSDIKLYNYNKLTDNNLTESEVLNKNYENIYYIKSELLLLLKIIEK